MGLSGPGIPWCKANAVTTTDKVTKTIDGKGYRGVEDRSLSEGCEAARRAAKSHYCNNNLEYICRKFNAKDSTLRATGKLLLAEIKSQKRNKEASLKCDPSQETAEARMETECGKTEYQIGGTATTD